MAKFSTDRSQGVDKPEPLIGAIPLTPDESGTLAAMKLHQEELFHDSDAAQRNGELAVTLMTSLRLRGAIPEVRLTYFEDPAYRTGRIRGSYRQLFERNKTVGDDIFRHPNFLRHFRYFLFGADLPNDVIEAFSGKALGYGHVGPSDALELGTLAKDLTRRHGLAARLDADAVAEEFYKLALDCRIYQGHALAIRDRVASIR
jgi:hypothetical protein